MNFYYNLFNQFSSVMRQLFFHNSVCIPRVENTRWWFQIFFISRPIWGNDPSWLICFKGVETWNHQPETTESHSPVISSKHRTNFIDGFLDQERIPGFKDLFMELASRLWPRTTVRLHYVYGTSSKFLLTGMGCNITRLMFDEVTPQNASLTICFADKGTQLWFCLHRLKLDLEVAKNNTPNTNIPRSSWMLSGWFSNCKRF